MIPNDYGLIRQPGFDLLAFLFPPLKSLTEYEITVIRPEYIKGYVLSGNGEPKENQVRQYAIVDLSGFEYAIMPNQGSPNDYFYTGLRSLKNAGQFSNISYIHFRTTAMSTCYSLFPITDLKYGCINTYIDNDLPVICFKRHRSDNVNPREIIQSLVPGNLRQAEDLTVQEPEEKQEEEQEEA